MVINRSISVVRSVIMKRFFNFLLLFFLVNALFGSKIPELTDQDVIKTLNQIMESHATCKNLSLTIVKRALEQYLEVLDPTKSYFLAGEVADWLKADDAALEKILDDLSVGNFAAFQSIHSNMVDAIKRRESFQSRLESADLPEHVSSDEFKELRWVNDEEELLTRLVHIRALQNQTIDKLDKSEARDKILQRLEKRRLAHQEEIVNDAEKKNFSLMRTNILKAFAASFDAHTAYFTPAEANQFLIQVQQRLFGIGVLLRDDLDGFTVVKIIEGSPAKGSGLSDGLQVNDRIIAINGEPVIGLEITDVVELIRGEIGTSVLITVLRNENEKHEIEIVRREVVIKEARIESSLVPFGDGVIAHISLHSFYQDPLHSSSSDLRDEILRIRSHNSVKGILLDLRYNAGGVLSQAVAVSGLFITKGIVVSIKDNRGALEHLRNIEGCVIYDGPLVILTSKVTASAAEIVAQTLQDYGRALVVGDEHTYGKGTFQTFTLDALGNGKSNPKGEFKVTRGRYYTVSGKSPQLGGVRPDIVVPSIYAHTEIGEKYSKFPLDNDSIGENFHDDLSDIPDSQRDQISWLYRFNLQPKIKTYNRHIAHLRKNSETRLQNNKFYQNFLAFLKDEKTSTEKIAMFTAEDPQLREGINILQDLILLLK